MPSGVPAGRSRRGGDRRGVASEDGSQLPARGCPSSLGRGEGAGWPHSQGRRGCSAWVSLPSAVCLSEPCASALAPSGTIPRCLAGRPCQQHPSGGGAQPEPHGPSASCLERGPGTPEEDGARKPQRASAWHDRVGREGSVCSGRPGARLWAATEPAPPGVGSGDVLITPQWLVRQTAAIPSWAVCTEESQRSVATGVQAEAFRATCSSR